MIVSGPREVLWARLYEKLGVPFSDEFRALGFVRGGLLCAVTGYNGFNGRTCFMHVAIFDGRLNKEFIKASFHYPFVQCGLKCVLITVESTNLKSRKLCSGLGFEEVMCIEDGARDSGDLILLKMTPLTCKWLGSESGKEQ